MTSLSNQELKKKTDELMKRLGWEYKPNKGGTYYWQKFDGVHKSQMTLTEARLLTELFESELANRERELFEMGISKFVKKVLLEHGKMEYTQAFSDDSYLIRVPREVMSKYAEGRLSELQNNSSKEEKSL